MKNLTPLARQLLLTTVVLVVLFLFGFYVSSYLFSVGLLESSNEIIDISQSIQEEKDTIVYDYYSWLGIISLLGIIFFGAFAIFYLIRIKMKKDISDLNKVWNVLLWLLLISIIVSAVLDLYSNVITYIPGHGLWNNIKYFYWSVISVDFLVGLLFMLPYVLLIGLTYWVIRINKK